MKMDIKNIIKKAYLDGIIEGKVIDKVNMNFDTEGMAEHYAENELKKLRVGDISGSQICPNCEKEHDSDEWSGYCSKICWWGFPIDCH
jgi:hypothetical protein